MRMFGNKKIIEIVDNTTSLHYKMPAAIDFNRNENLLYIPEYYDGNIVILKSDFKKCIKEHNRVYGFNVKFKSLLNFSVFSGDYLFNKHCYFEFLTTSQKTKWKLRK